METDRTTLRRTEFWLWTIRDAATGKTRVTRHRMTADDAASFHPGAVRVPGSLELREVAQSKDAELSASIDTWVRAANHTGRVALPDI